MERIGLQRLCFYIVFDPVFFWQILIKNMRPLIDLVCYVLSVIDDKETTQQNALKSYLAISNSSNLFIYVFMYIKNNASSASVFCFFTTAKKLIKALLLTWSFSLHQGVGL